MLPYALRPRSGVANVIHTAFLCGTLAFSVLVFAGCSDKGTPAPAKAESASAAQASGQAPAGASKATDAAKPDASKPADAPKTAADAAKDAASKAPAVPPAKTDAAKSDAAKAEMGKVEPPKAEAPKVVLDTPKPAGADSTRTVAPEANPKAGMTAGMSDKGALDAHGHTAEEHAAQEAKMKAAAAMKGATPDPFGQDTDPNSKARLTYEFGSDTKTFGKVMQGDVLNWKFQMQSSGEEDLVIKQAKPTCGCTVAQIMVEENETGKLEPYQYGKPIPPGKKIEIDATLHTANKRGHASSKINISTNDPRGQTILGLEADVEPFFQVNPPSVNFAQLGAKDTATDKVQISTSKGDRVKLSAVKDNMPQGLKIDLNALDADADGKASRYELVVTAGPGLVEGNMAYSVPLRSDAAIPGGEKMPNGLMPTYEVAVTIMARVNGAISFNPAFVSLGLIRPGQTLSRTVRIQCHDADFKLDPKVSVQGRDTAEWEFSKYFTSLVRPVLNENSVDVEITLNGMPETLAGSFSGMLVVNLGHPEKPEIKLPITGVCRGGAAPPPGGTPMPAPTPVPVPNPPK
jgi:hypothetical protein